MSLARKVLLAMSTNAWLRERATKTAFVRRSVSTFMPGERLEDAMAAAAAQQAQGIDTIFTKLGENLTRIDEAEEVTRSLSRRARQGPGRRARRADLGQADAARARSRQGAVLPQSAAADRSRGRARQLRLDRHGELAVCRSDARLVPPRRARASPRVGIALQAYLYRTDRRRRIAGAARRGDPAREGRVSRAAVRRVSEESGRRRELLQAGVPAARRRRAERRRTAAHRHARSEACRSACRVHRRAPRARRPRTSSRCCTASSGRCSSASSPPAVRCACWSPTASTGFAWYMRRLAERPANVWFVVKNLFT